MNTEYKYKKQLNESDLMMLGCILEGTDRHHNKVSFCNEIFGLFNERAEKSREQLEKYIDDNFTVSESYPYIWTDTREWAYL